MFKTKTNKTLSDIVLGFDNMISEIEALMQRNDVASRDKREQAALLRMEADDLDAETGRAAAVREHLQKLIGKV